MPESSVGDKDLQELCQFFISSVVDAKHPTVARNSKKKIKISSVPESLL